MPALKIIRILEINATALPLFRETKKILHKYINHYNLDKYFLACKESNVASRELKTGPLSLISVTLPFILHLPTK